LKSMTPEIDGYMIIPQKIIGIVAGLLAAAGLPRNSAKILAVLYLSSTPLTLRELMSITGYSKSTLFAALRTLREWDFVSRLRSRGKVLYMPSKDLASVIIRTHHSTIDRFKNLLRETRAENGSTLSRRILAIEDELERLKSRLRGEGQ